MLAKNKAVKIKIIPEILIKDLPDLSNPEHFFTPTQIGRNGLQQKITVEQLRNVLKRM
jgi:hypothetical protein